MRHSCIGRSLTELRETRPDVGPGQIVSNGKRVWVREVTTTDLLHGPIRSTRPCGSALRLQGTRFRRQMNRFRGVSPTASCPDFQVAQR